MVDLQRQLSSLGQQVEAKQGELDNVQQRLNDRLAALGQREQSFAAIDRQQSQAEYKLEQLLVQTSRAAAELTRHNGELGQVERELADKQRTLSVTSTRLDRTQKQLAGLDEQVSSLIEQRTAIEAEIARRGDIAKRVTDIRGRLGSLLGTISLSSGKRAKARSPRPTRFSKASRSWRARASPCRCRRRVRRKAATRTKRPTEAPFLCGLEHHNLNGESTPAAGPDLDGAERVKRAATRPGRPKKCQRWWRERCLRRSPS
jgi:chromosome segregation ATPase